MRPALKKETPVQKAAQNEPARHIAFASDVGYCYCIASPMSNRSPILNEQPSPAGAPDQ